MLVAGIKNKERKDPGLFFELPAGADEGLAYSYETCGAVNLFSPFYESEVAPDLEGAAATSMATRGDGCSRVRCALSSERGGAAAHPAATRAIVSSNARDGIVEQHGAAH